MRLFHTCQPRDDCGHRKLLRICPVAVNRRLAYAGARGHGLNGYHFGSHLLQQFESGAQNCVSCTLAPWTPPLLLLTRAYATGCLFYHYETLRNVMIKVKQKFRKAILMGIGDESGPCPMHRMTTRNTDRHTFFSSRDRCPGRGRMAAWTASSQRRRIRSGIEGGVGRCWTAASIASCTRISHPRM